MAKLRITYTKSAIGYSKDQKATIRSLGLHKLNSNVIQRDTPAIRGMIFKVQHLVKVEEVGDNTTTMRTSATRRPIVTPAAAPSAPVVIDEPETIDELDAADEIEAVDELEAADEIEAADELEAADEIEAADELDAAGDLTAVDDQSAADDLTMIEGIGPKIAGVLREAGIGTFAQLAATDVARLTEILQDANLRLAAPESWPEQAGLAAADDWDALKELQDRLKGGRRE
jgi:large subunit ribosomal protein L30